MDTLKDRFGNDITVGALVTFPTRVSSSLYVRDGVVTQIESIPVFRYAYTEELKAKTRPRVFIRVQGESKDTYTDMIDRLTVVKVPA